VGLTLEGIQPIGKFGPVWIFGIMSERLDISDQYVREQLPYRLDCLCSVNRHLFYRIVTVELLLIDVTIHQRAGHRHILNIPS
jgi:hypothetical protein